MEIPSYAPFIILRLQFLYAENADCRALFTKADKKRNGPPKIDLDNLGKTVESLENSIQPHIEESERYKMLKIAYYVAHESGVIDFGRFGFVRTAKDTLGFGEKSALKQHVDVLVHFIMTDEMPET